MEYLSMSDLERFFKVESAIIPTFLAREFPNALPRTSEHPRITSIGKLAPTNLSAFRNALTNAGVRVEGIVNPYATLQQLQEDPTWTITSVLAPHKLEVLTDFKPAPPEKLIVTPSVKETKVADTIVRSLTGEIFAVNTNTYAAQAAIKRLGGEELQETALIVGTGASARSVAAALIEVFPNIVIGVVGRSHEKASAVIEDLGIKKGTVVKEPNQFETNLIVHTTTVGQTDDTQSLDFNLPFTLGVRFFDINNRASKLQEQALTAGCVVMGGRLMQRITNQLRVALLRPPDTHTGK